MSLYEIGGSAPALGEGAWVAPSADVIGDVRLGARASVWFGAILRADWVGWAALLWQTIGNTLFGYVVWNWLLSRHPASQVAPLGLLVPVFGLSAAAWFLGEPLPLWKLAAAALIIAGLVINLRARPNHVEAAE